MAGLRRTQCTKRTGILPCSGTVVSAPVVLRKPIFNDLWCVRRCILRLPFLVLKYPRNDPLWKWESLCIARIFSPLYSLPATSTSRVHQMKHPIPLRMNCLTRFVDSQGRLNLFLHTHHMYVVSCIFALRHMYAHPLHCSVFVPVLLIFHALVNKNERKYTKI